MNSLKKTHKKIAKQIPETETKKDSGLEYASLYDDAGPTEEERLQMQLAAKDAADHRKRYLFRQHMTRFLTIIAALVFIALIIYSFYYYKKETEITTAAVSTASESVTVAASQFQSANQSTATSSPIQVSNTSLASSSTSILSSADILPGISHGNYHIYDPNASYQTVRETVTASGDSVNLRTLPSIENGSTIITNIQKGQILTRTAIGANGWSELSYNGKTVYAVTGLLSQYADSASAAASATVSDAANTASEEAVKASVAAGSE